MCVCVLDVPNGSELKRAKIARHTQHARAHTHIACACWCMRMPINTPKHARTHARCTHAGTHNIHSLTHTPQSYKEKDSNMKDSNTNKLQALL